MDRERNLGVKEGRQEGRKEDEKKSRLVRRE
jgi:hypothetical protein